MEQIKAKPFIEAYAITNQFGQYMRQEPINVVIFATAKGKDGAHIIKNVYDLPEIDLLKNMRLSVDKANKRCLLKLGSVIKEKNAKVITGPSIDYVKIHSEKLFRSMEHTHTEGKNAQLRYRPSLEVVKRYFPQNNHLVKREKRINFIRGDQSIGNIATFNAGNVAEGVDNAVSYLIHHKMQVTDSAVEKLFYSKYLNNDNTAYTRGPDNLYTKSQDKATNATITNVETALLAVQDLYNMIEYVEKNGGKQVQEEVKEYVRSHLLPDERIENDLADMTEKLTNRFIDDIVKNSFKK